MAVTTQSTTRLKKTISVWKGLGLAVSIVIGSGLLGLPGLALEIGNVYTAAAGWICITITLVPLIYIFSYLGLKFTSSAGLARYAHIALGDWGNHAVTAILCGTFVMGVPVLALIGGAYTQSVLDLSPSTVYIIGLGILIFATLINLTGVAIVTSINIISLCALILMTGLIVFSNLQYFLEGLSVFRTITGGEVHMEYTTIWRTSALLFWAYIGWENLSFNLDEFKNPGKTIPAVYWLSFALVSTLYLALSLTTIGAHNSGLATQGASGLISLVEKSLLGKFQIAIMIVVISANASAWIMSTSRLYYAAGQNGILPPLFGKLSKNNIPVNSFLFSMLAYAVVLLCAYLFRFSISNLVLIENQNFLLLYVVSIFAYWKSDTRKRKWFISFSALVSCGFLLSGFSWWIIYPIILVGLGYFNYLRIRKK